MRRRVRRAAVLPLLASMPLFMGSTAGASSQGIYRAVGFQIIQTRYAGSATRVLKVTSGYGLALKPVLAYPAFAPSGRHTSQIATAHAALVATNGDFVTAGGLAHLMILNGEIFTSGTQHGWEFTETADGSQAWIGPTFKHLQLLLPPEDKLPIAEWNAGQAHNGRLSVFTWRGGTRERPQHGPTAVLLPSGAASQRGDATVRPYRVARLSTGVIQPPRGSGLVLQGAAVTRLRPQDAVAISTNFGHPGIANAFGGMPQVERAGVNIGVGCAPGHCGHRSCGRYHCDPPLRAKNPRTAVGVSPGCEDSDPATICTLFLVTIDGRQPGWSPGVQFPGLGALFVRLGASDALNLDGGGSTEMWMRGSRSLCQKRTPVGCLIDRSPYGERTVQQSIILLRR